MALETHAIPENYQRDALLKSIAFLVVFGYCIIVVVTGVMLSFLYAYMWWWHQTSDMEWSRRLSSVKTDCGRSSAAYGKVLSEKWPFKFLVNFLHESIHWPILISLLNFVILLLIVLFQFDTGYAVAILFGLFNTLSTFFKIVGRRGRQKTLTFLQQRYGYSSDPQRLSVVDKYTDFGFNAVGTFLVAVAQLILVVMFIPAGYYNKCIFWPADPFCVDLDVANIDQGITFYVLGLFVQMGYLYTSDVRLQQLQNTHFWSVMFEWQANGVEYKAREDSREFHRVGRCGLWMRFILSLLGNEMGAYAILMLLPLTLSGSENMLEFVLNSVAAYVILELDNSAEKFLIREPGGETAVVDVEMEAFVVEGQNKRNKPVEESACDDPPTKLIVSTAPSKVSLFDA